MLQPKQQWKYFKFQAIGHVHLTEDRVTYDDDKLKHWKWIPSQLFMQHFGGRFLLKSAIVEGSVLLQSRKLDINTNKCDTKNNYRYNTI